MISLFFFNDTATTEIYTLSLHDALPIYIVVTKRLNGNDGRGRVIDSAWRVMLSLALFGILLWGFFRVWVDPLQVALLLARDRKSTRLNSIHQIISYAVFCLKKKKNIKKY